VRVGKLYESLVLTELRVLSSLGVRNAHVGPPASEPSLASASSEASEDAGLRTVTLSPLSLPESPLAAWDTVLIAGGTYCCLTIPPG
jgi:hypothetical protein